MEIKVNFEEFTDVHLGIENAAEKLESVTPRIEKPSSDSEAMEVFVKRVKKLKRLKKQYEELLENDSFRLMTTSTSFGDMDSKLAEEYAGTIYDNRKICPAKGSAYSDVLEKQQQRKA